MRSSRLDLILVWEPPAGSPNAYASPQIGAVKCPQGLTLHASMIIGTAGFTAAECVQKLEQAGMTLESGPVLVTGATGGVGSVAVKLLAQLGYDVTAVTGRMRKGTG